MPVVDAGFSPRRVIHAVSFLYFLRMMTTSGSFTTLLSECEREPIHIPGRIQPFGVLMTVDPDTLVIQNLSENCLKLWDRHSFALLGRSLSEFMSEHAFAALKNYLDLPSREDQAPLRVSLNFDEFAKREWEMRAHYCKDVLYLEWEVADSGAAAFEADEFPLRVRQIVHALQSADSLQNLCDRAVEQAQMTTGFDRVMVYRFEEDWHGVVVSEVCRNGMDAYLGLHFPASDIPAQARAIFLQNSLRMIPDAEYAPARIHPGVHPASGEPLDLSRATLRSVSPVHLEYLKNMLVKASLTISLVKDGKLWGLIACHHASPLKINSDARVAAELIGRLVSSQLAIKEENEQRSQKTLLDQAVPVVLTKLEQAGDLAQGLRTHMADLQALGARPAGGVAICYENVWTVAGNAPPVDALEALLTWIVEQFPDQPLFCTDQLSRDYAPAAAYRDVASGVQAMVIARSQRHAILWFRPETAMTVTWAGRPDKAVQQEGERVTLHPRASFASWKEIVHGKAIAWKKFEADALGQLHTGIQALALKQVYRLEQMARERAERLSREKDEMVAMVSHDLRTPLNVVSLSLDYLQRYHLTSEPAIQGMMERGKRAAKLMESLVTNVLDAAKIEAGTLDMDVKPVKAADLVRDVMDMTVPVAQEKGVQLSALPHNPAWTVCCERFRIGQVLSNLVGNALKFTPHGGTVTVAVESRDQELLFSVRDTGEGIPAAHQGKIFEPYWQADDTRRLGSGLGLAIAKGIIEMHHGRIWVESEPGRGSTFYFTLPQQDC